MSDLATPPVPPTPPPVPSTLAVAVRAALTGGAAVLILAGLFWFFELRVRSTPAPPAPPISLPATVTAHVGRICTIEAVTTGKLVKWAVISGPDKPDLLQ